MQKNTALFRNPRIAAAVLACAALLMSGAGAAAQTSEAPPLTGAFAGNFTLLDPPVPAPLVAFKDGNEQRTTLQDFAGKVVLVNFWATWCAPCVAEMPSLNSLQRELRDEGFEILAISQDRRGLKVVTPFYEKHGLDALAVFLDGKGAAARAFELRGLPTTYLVDRQNRIVGLLAGPAEWDSDEAKTLIRHYLRQTKAEAKVPEDRDG